ncbi:hypothetical protein DPMN_086573 [Dreissena polymorpha]|uniref:AB hydrolase-1 domain-containing protein n=2 Tax=Dreissena polymorpha TaxID=45954 RepID=A0A9D4KR93_DREPO|nr:hypothetical protein DPMN_086573 [Dreissena polymorpha]
MTVITTKENDKTVDFIKKETDKLLKKGVHCTLKKFSFRSLDSLRLEAKDVSVTQLCILESFKDKQFESSGSLWSTLGTIYKQQGQESAANRCFKQAKSIMGPYSEYVKEWSFIGPFVIGKTEVDGDPVESFGGIREVSKFRFKKNAKMYSELSSGGEINWMFIKQAGPDKGIQVQPKINWNELVNSLGSMGITEWQGWLVGEFAVNEKGLDLIVQCLGPHTVFIDDVPVPGDVYHRQKYWFGVSVDQGLHTIYIRVRTKINAQVHCQFTTARNGFELLSPNFLPDLLDGQLFGKHLAVPVANYDSSNFVKITKVTLSDIESKISDVSGKLDVKMLNPSVLIAPGQTYALNLVLYSTSSSDKLISHCSEPESPWDIRLNLKVTTSIGVSSLPITIRCRKGKQSFLFTFRDHDGSIQHAAAIQPLEHCPGDVCPTVLSLHGTTIPPQNQADSYKHMVGGEFVFGFPRAWTLAPTRHGAHNWEGPGLLTAMTALDSLSSMTRDCNWIQNKADSKHVVYAGHSMGGHGAWHVATHFPDRALALVSLASWIKKEEYGDSNLFFRHDIATSHVDPALKSILESCIIENDADQHSVNLGGVPVVGRTGAIDRTVHPWFLRRMYRLLSEEGVKVNYTEVKDKEHWWWDTVDTNDGGAVNDKYLRDFTNFYIDQFLDSKSSGSCTGPDAEDCQDDPILKYTDGQESRSFRLVCYNPALGEGVGGVQVLQQCIPFRKSEIQVEVTWDVVKFQTKNVARFSVLPHFFKEVLHKNIYIDGQSTAMPSDMTSVAGENVMNFCLKSGWGQCSDDQDMGLLRGTLTLGPARRVAEQPFRIIIGTQGSEESQRVILKSAVYVANLFFLTSDCHVDIVKDTDISINELDRTHIIVIGNSSENIHVEKLISRIPIQPSSAGIRLATCNYAFKRSGILTLVPNGPHHLGLVLMGTTLVGLQDVISLAAPTIPPMTRSPFSNLIPDFVITGPDFGRKGPGGYLCAGFYGNKWQFRTDSASCTC